MGTFPDILKSPSAVLHLRAWFLFFLGDQGANCRLTVCVPVSMCTLESSEASCGLSTTRSP